MRNPLPPYEIPMKKSKKEPIEKVIDINEPVVLETSYPIEIVRPTEKDVQEAELAFCKFINEGHMNIEAAIRAMLGVSISTMVNSNLSEEDFDNNLVSMKGLFVKLKAKKEAACT